MINIPGSIRFDQRLIAGERGRDADLLRPPVEIDHDLVRAARP